MGMFRRDLPEGCAGERAGLQLVWLHGWGQTHASLLKIGEFFIRRAHNHFFDFPGFGQSTMLEEGAGTIRYAEALKAELEALPAGKRILIGHSFGCRVATRLAARHPELVDGIAFMGGAGIPRDRSLAWKIRARYLKFLGTLARTADRLLGTAFQEAYRSRFGSADYKAAGKLRATFLATVSENLTEDARKVSCPVLLLYGAEDTETPPAVGEKFKAAFQNAELVVLPGFGHLDILTRGAAQCQTQISRFLDKVTQ